MRHISGGHKFRPRGGLLPILGERRSSYMSTCMIKTQNSCMRANRFGYFFVYIEILTRPARIHDRSSTAY